MESIARRTHPLEICLCLNPANFWLAGLMIASEGLMYSCSFWLLFSAIFCSSTWRWWAMVCGFCLVSVSERRGEGLVVVSVLVLD